MQHGAHAPTPPRGKPVEIRCFVEADHAVDKLTRRLRMGIVIFLYGVPIIWYSNKQNTVKTSTFGSEFVALKIAAEMLRGLRYKLCMMGIPIVDPSYVYCDNNYVVMKSTVPASMLKKKSNSIAYHVVQWDVAADEMHVTHVATKDNLADILTKQLPAGAKLDYLVYWVLHDIVNEVTPRIHKAHDV
jgi:hypothetical protein